METFFIHMSRKFEWSFSMSSRNFPTTGLLCYLSRYRVTCFLGERRILVQ